MDEDEIYKQARRVQKTSNLSSASITSNPYISSNTHPYKLQSAGVSTGASSSKQYSLAEVQLVGGEMIGMMITAGPALGQHLTKQMGTDGYLYLYNDNESLVLKADRIVAVKLTKMTTE